MIRLLVLVVVVVVAGCEIAAEELPGRPCAGASDCGDAFACVRVPGRETSVCVSKPPPEEVVGCAGADDGDACGDGDACTVDDACAGGACVGVAKDCGADLCVDGVCSVVAACDDLAPVVAASSAQTPRIAYNPLDDEIGLVFEAPVLARTEVFFSRLGADGVPRGAPVQLTDGTPATQDDSDVSSFVRDIAFAPEEQRYGVLVADSQLVGGGVSFVPLTSDGIPVTTTRMVRELASAFSLTPARLTWTGAQFVMAARTVGQDNDSIVVDDVDADGNGADLIDSTVEVGFFGGVDVAAGRGRPGEVGIAYVNRDIDGNDVDVRFVRAAADGDALVEHALSSGPGENVEIAATDAGYVVVWQEGADAATRRLFAAALDDDGAVVVAARAVTAAGENAQLAGIAAAGAGVVVVCFATVEAALAIQLRRLENDLTAQPPTTLRTGLAGGFAPTVDAAAGTSVVGYGAGATDDGSGVDVEVAKVCD